MPIPFSIGGGAGGPHAAADSCRTHFGTGEPDPDGVAIADIDAWVATSNPSAAELTRRMA